MGKEGKMFLIRSCLRFLFEVLVFALVMGVILLGFVILRPS